MCLAGLIVITAVNLWGIAESARVLMLPMVVFLAAIFGVIVNADTARLIPLYAIGVFTGFTISQTGLVHHWYTQRSPRWLLRAASTEPVRC